MRMIANAAAVLVAATIVQLPAPTGRYPVGTTSWHVTDPSRKETLAGDGGPRQVEVLAWYPAASNRGPLAPYLREGLGEVQGFATLLRGARTAFDRLSDVSTHARLDAPPAATPAKLPVLVFSHGFGSLAAAYTALLEDLASHGYAVLSILHPYEVGGATLDDGRVVSFLDEAGKPRPSYLDVVGEWAGEDEAMAAVTQASGDEEQRRRLRGYLAGVPHTHATVRRWADDTALVLDRLAQIPRASAAGKLAARLDTGRIGVFGHSMGGVSAGQFCVDDRRCRGGLNLDGIPQSGTVIDRPASAPAPPFLMVYSARPGRAGANDAIYRRVVSTYYRVDVAGTRHLDFSDMILWGGRLRDVGALGSVEPARAVDITRTIVREYFDQVLRGRRSPLLNGTPTLPEVSVQTSHDGR
jgi:pimeloyl-ACP methyl ester carboxylesterase